MKKMTKEEEEEEEKRREKEKNSWLLFTVRYNIHT